MTICFHYDMVLGTGHFYEKHVGLDMFNPVKYVNTVLNLVQSGLRESFRIEIRRA